MANESAIEQLLLELINRARLDPAAEAARFGIALNEGLAPGTITAASKQPLAGNDILQGIARTHSVDMINRDYFAHNTPEGVTPFQRMTNAGYVFTVPGENIAWSGTTGTVNDALSVSLHSDLFIDEGIAGRGHRLNILNPNFKEVGLGETRGQFTIPGGTFNATMLTQDFGTRASTQFLTGVAFVDTVVDDNFYSVGEGRAGATVAITSGASATTGAAGGYSALITAGSRTVTFSGGGLASPVSLTATILAENAKIDLMDAATIRTSVSVTEISGITRIVGLGTNDLTLTTGSGTDTLIGAKGNDTLNGGTGNDYMLGGEGNDTYHVDHYNDLVDEDIVFPGFGHGGFDTIISHVDWYWDVYSIAEKMVIAADAVDPSSAGTTLVGSIFSNEMIGNAKTNVLFGRGGADAYRAGDGVDYISLSLLGLTEQNAYVGVNGANTIIVDQRTTGANSYDIIFEFESGKDKVNVASYGYTNVNQVLARGHNDGAGNSYFALGDGLDYVYFVGLTTAQVSGVDFII